VPTVTLRKPRGMSYQDWTEVQIRSAQQAGVFEGLAGAGKPIPDIDRRRNDMEWIVNYLSRENVDVRVVLPPALALAKEVEDLPDRLAPETSEAVVREVIAELNARIHRAHRIPHDGPPMRVWEVDVERAIARWVERRSAMPAGSAAELDPVQAPADARSRMRRLLARLNQPTA
jgi:hypothetical protein